MKTDTKTSQQVLVINRIFNAPVELVWRSWTNPDHFMRWWGPKNFTCPFCEIDFHVGSTYLACMRSPEGGNYWSTGVYREIIPMRRIIYTDCFADEKGNIVPASYYGMPGENWPVELLVRVTFEDLEGKTRINLRHSGIPSGEMAKLAEQGWNESFDKLAECLRA
jgi:uncharacterized protein YndB with AHSA1/START domain